MLKKLLIAALYIIFFFSLSHNLIAQEHEGQAGFVVDEKALAQPENRPSFIVEEEGLRRPEESPDSIVEEEDIRKLEVKPGFTVEEEGAGQPGGSPGFIVEGEEFRQPEKMPDFIVEEEILPDFLKNEEIFKIQDKAGVAPGEEKPVYKYITEPFLIPDHMIPAINYYISSDITRKFSGLIINVKLERIYGIYQNDRIGTVYFDYSYNSMRNMETKLYEKGKMTFLKFNSGKWFNEELSVFLLENYYPGITTEEPKKEE